MTCDVRLRPGVNWPVIPGEARGDASDIFQGDILVGAAELSLLGRLVNSHSAQ